MSNNHKVLKAFTLAEIFITMVVLSVLVAVCVSFFNNNRRDYHREYAYYTAYKNLVKVVDTLLFKNTYLGSRVDEETTCGPTASKKRCRAFKTSVGSTTNLCSMFKEYFNVSHDSCGTTFSSVPPSTDTYSLKLTNGMVFYFKELSPAAFAGDILKDDTLEATETQGYTLWVDIDGYGIGEGKENYDIMKFYITRSGRVIPAYGSVANIRGYDFTPATQDGGGNPNLMAFDVIYNESATTNSVKVLSDAFRHVSFPVAACASGYVSANTLYCKNFNGAGGAALAKNSTCDNAVSDCKIRLVNKLRRTK